MIETLRSCLILPSPLRTLRVSLNVRPNAIDVCLACSGFFTSGAVAISISGIPRRSRFQVTTSPLEVNSLSNLRALSSSKQRTSIPTGPPFVCSTPAVATNVVR